MPVPVPELGSYNYVSETKVRVFCASIANVPTRADLTYSFLRRKTSIGRI